MPTLEDMFKTTDEFIRAVSERAEAKDTNNTNKRPYKPVAETTVLPNGQRLKYRQK